MSTTPQKNLKTTTELNDTTVYSAFDLIIRRTSRMHTEITQVKNSKLIPLSSHESNR